MRREKIPKMDFLLLLHSSSQLSTSEFNEALLQSPLIFSLSLSLQAQIKILNLMDKKEKAAQALQKKRSSLMELEAQIQKVGRLM
jgi:hypothetical protein